MSIGREILVEYFNHHIDKLTFGRKFTLDLPELGFILQKRLEIRRGRVSADLAVLEVINFVPWMFAWWATDPAAPAEAVR